MHANHQRIIDALRADPEHLIEWAAERLVALGAKSEWDMDDNFETTESLVGLSVFYDLPAAWDQREDALLFYGLAAIELGYPADVEDIETTATCRHCGRGIAQLAGRWIDPEAGFDDEDGDGIWRETCDSHDTATAEHEPDDE